MRFFRRSLIALGVAATLPTLLFAAVGAFYLLRSERQQVESTALERSRTLVTLSDALMRESLGVLNVLSTSVYFDTADWKEYYPRLRRVLEGAPHLATIRIFDAQSGAEILDLRRPLDTSTAATLPGSVNPESLRTATTGLIDGVTIDADPVVYLYQPVRRNGELRYVIAAAIHARAFQAILVRQVPAGTVAALVDRDGNFVARTFNYEQRVGRPATHYVRDAIRAAKHGVYPGTTYEGLKNYTAFDTSSWSGISAHIAVASSLIDTPTSWSFAVLGIAGVGSLALGAVLALLVLRDMAERRRAEETLRQSQKMEAVGQLTGGIAHDFNNLLTAVIGNLDMIRSRSGDNARVRQLADNALEAARRGAKLTSQLLAFSRSQRMHLQTVDLQNLLGGMSTLLEQSVGASIRVSLVIADDARFVTSDQNQLELALLNLAVNARDAMPRGGLLDISTQTATGIYLRDLPRQRYVEIRVTDTGEGMSEAVRSRAIEPFFTTKQVGQGTGLGLSQVYGVVRESGGTLHIESEPGRGTTVRMLLLAADPLVIQPSAPAIATTPATPVAADRPRASILIADDDRQVRRFMAESLRQRHYEVVDVENGPAALERLDQRRFDLLLVDFAMPGMNGAQVAHAARAVQRDLRILLVSGYADSATIEATLGATPLLRKPFDVHELETAVVGVLDGQ